MEEIGRHKVGTNYNWIGKICGVGCVGLLSETGARVCHGEYLFMSRVRRYISIYRHLQRNPDNQFYPLFEYFENWCQVGSFARRD